MMRPRAPAPDASKEGGGWMLFAIGLGIVGFFFLRSSDVTTQAAWNAKYGKS